jgi:hypothetical protein
MLNPLLDSQSVDTSRRRRFKITWRQGAIILLLIAFIVPLILHLVPTPHHPTNPPSDRCDGSDFSLALGNKPCASGSTIRCCSVASTFDTVRCFDDGTECSVAILSWFGTLIIWIASLIIFVCVLCCATCAPPSLP